MALYEIKSDIEAIVNDEGILVNTNTGEALTREQFEELVSSFDAGVENLVLWIKNLRAEAKAIKEEKDNLAARQKAAENKADNLAEYVMYLLEGKKFKTAKCSVSYRASHPLVIDDQSVIPAEYWKQADPTIDKAGITKAIKDGIEVPGCRLGDSQNIQIK